MKLPNPELWQKLNQLSFSPPNALVSFTERLAHENGWTTKFAAQVVLEYKKFIYLLCVTNAPLTPSDEVDQAWHLHLAYSQNYWEEMCDGLLQRRIHHTPTEGGTAEMVKFRNLYQATLDAYGLIFGEAPSEIWPDKKKRFAPEIVHVRVPLDRYQVLDKRFYAFFWISLTLAGAGAVPFGGTLQAISISVAATLTLVLSVLVSLSPSRFNRLSSKLPRGSGCNGNGCNNAAGHTCSSSGCGGGGD